MARRTPYVPYDDFAPSPIATPPPPILGPSTYGGGNRPGPMPYLGGPPSPTGAATYGNGGRPGPMPAFGPPLPPDFTPVTAEGSLDQLLHDLIGSLNVTAPSVPQPEAPDYTKLLAPYAQARDAANQSAVAGRGVIGDATTQATNTINQLRDQYAALQAQNQSQMAAHQQAQAASLSSALAPIAQALQAQGVDGAPLQQQAGNLQGVLTAGNASADQLAAQRNMQAVNDMGGRQQDTQLIKESALGTLQNNLNAALQKIGLGESQARNAYQQQYEAAKRAAADKQWAVDQQAAQENRATAKNLNSFIASLRKNGPDGKALAQSMVDDYAAHSPTGYNSRAIQAFNTIVNGDGGNLGKPASQAEALSRVPQFAKDLRLDPGVLKAWVNAYYTPAKTELPPDWREQLAQYVSALQGF